MATSAALQKREQLVDFANRKLIAHSAVQAVIGIGSIASGLAHAGSDIDAAVFLDPFDLYIVPAEAIWQPTDDTFHSIFIEDEELQRNGLRFDFKRLDLQVWRSPSYEWPEPMRAELGASWIAFDRSGEVQRLIAERTAYSDAVRVPRLDEAITWLDQHLSEDKVPLRWETLGAPTAHDRLQAAYENLVQGLFAYNRRWRTWRNREMTALLQMPWLPENFEGRVLTALVAPGHNYHGYLQRAEMLQQLFRELLERLTMDGLYGDDPIGEAFIRTHEEPGRAWNMNAWNGEHRKRYPGG